MKRNEHLLSGGSFGTERVGFVQALLIAWCDLLCAIIKFDDLVLMGAHVQVVMMAAGVGMMIYVALYCE